MVTSSSNNAHFASPIKHLEASLAASSAHSTIVAIRCDDCVILVSRSQKEEASELMPREQDSETTMFEGLTVCKDRGNRWKRLTSTTVCTMTGLTADVQHLMGVLTRQVESHQALYCDSQPIQLTIRNLATIFRRTAQREGSRPFGAQALMVGREASGWQIYTVDPTGLWRHFGSGSTAIGRHADKVKEALKEALEEVPVLNAKLGLDMALSSIMKGVSKSNEKFDSDTYSGLLISMDENGCCQMSKITADSIDECYKRYLKQLLM